MKILDRIERSKDCWFLIVTSFFFFLLRLPSLFEPYWYGDEGIYQVVGTAIKAGRLLYSEIWDNKPPLLYLLYAVFSSDQFLVRLVSLVFGLFSIFAFYALCRKFYPKIVFWATGFFALLFGLPLLEGNIANAENFMILPILIAAFLIYNTTNYTLYAKRYTLFIAGLLLGVSFLFKIVAVFDFAAFLIFLFLLFMTKKKPITHVIKNLIPFVLAFLTPITITSLFFFSKGIFQDFFDATFRQNVGYVGYGNQLLFPQGLLLAKLLLILALIVVLYQKRELLSKQILFIILWFGFSLFNAFFSQRPYAHYLLVILPSSILMTSMLFVDKNLSKKHRGKAVGLLLIILFFILTNFTFYGKTASYYQNFIAFITNQKSVSDYQSFFDRQTINDYAVSLFLRTHLTERDQVYIWGNSAQIYTLSGKLPPGRYTVAYHVTASAKSIQETQLMLSFIKPKFIVASLSQSTIPLKLYGYRERIMLYDSIIYERVL